MASSKNKGSLFPAQINCDNKDRISKLPDDILLRLLSPMGMKEAAKTSILSKSWRCLWANRTHLDFNHMIVLPEINPDLRKWVRKSDERSKYINWVNQVVDLNCSPCIDTFRVLFDLRANDAHHIEKWWRFAMSKKVKNLELNVWTKFPLYTIEFDKLKPSMSLIDNISLLTSLHLNSINVSGDFLEYLLSRCCFLERLNVQKSDTLVRLKVGGSSCKLKQLTIGVCFNLEELEIDDAMDLIYFEFDGTNYNTKLVFKSTPVLVEAVFDGDDLLDASVSFFNQISPLPSHISKLSISLMFYLISAPVVPTFCNLNQLTLVVREFKYFDAVAMAHLLVACPVLHEFKLEIRWIRRRLEPMEAYELSKVDAFSGMLVRETSEVEDLLDLAYLEVLESQRKACPNLKVLRVVGFSGCDSVVDLILFIAVWAPNLETIICDTTRISHNLSWDLEPIRNRGKKLRSIIPPKISLVTI